MAQLGRLGIFGLSVIVVSLFAHSAEAGALDCAFKPRADQVYIDELPVEVVGSINCKSPELPINVLYVVRAPKARVDFLNWFEGYEDQMVPGRDKRRISKESTTRDAQTWFEIETRRGPGRILHLIFESPQDSGSELTLIYTDTEMRMKRFSKSLFPLAKTLMSRDYLSGIEEALREK